MSLNARRYCPKGRSRHHLLPRSRGGQNDAANLLLLKIERHENWHKIFGNLTLDEIIALLVRTRRLKSRQNPT